MQGKTFVTILGLLLFQALAALFIGMSVAQSFELIVAVVFIITALGHVLKGKRARPGMGLVLVFGLGFINVVYLSLISISLWLVVMLCLDAAGFILALDQLSPPPKKRTSKPSVARKDLIAKELPTEEKAAVVVYKEQPKKRGRPKGTTKKKTAKKKTAKKKTVKKKVAKKKTAKKTVKKTTTKKRGRPKGSKNK